MERFSIDESGYTGFDLMNPEQQFQGATALSINDQDAARLIKEHFPNYKHLNSSTVALRVAQQIIDACSICKKMFCLKVSA
ncbi:hypothetical protein [Methylotenera sp.]|uniref:hypothetical protein n=1 Tax=Methylotenera sp. TaxID=2051956 RepID=UPI002733A127|nr:hypothetical protein [Methylotenera sp.]MDP3777632.1 hypothetical protein [Methylotenera sp.]